MSVAPDFTRQDSSDIFQSHSADQQSPPSDKMQTTVSSLDAVGKAAGAGKEVTAYLADRQIKTVRTLALIAKDDAHLERVLMQPLLSGWRGSDGTELRLSEADNR